LKVYDGQMSASSGLSPFSKGGNGGIMITPALCSSG
jgi:hypothetical protein